MKISGALNGAGDFLCAQTGGADPGRAVRPVVVDFHPLKVGEPAALGLVHGVAHSVARHRSLAADLTELRHRRGMIARARAG